MIAEPTVLILGAGASIPFGFPSGSALKKEIVNLTNGEGELMRWLLASNFSRNQIVAFAEALGASLFSSVDRFLEFTLGDHRKVGCAAIAAEILLKSQALEALREYDWMQILFGALAPEFEEALDNGHLVVVTYNYDCSFEYLLWRGLQSSIQSTRAEATFDKIKVIHLHGRLAPSKDPRQAFPIGPETIQESFNDLVEGVVPIHERNPDMEIFNQAREFLGKAKRVCFLGFGYDGTNLQRLRGEPDNPSWQNAEFLSGSAFDRTEIENWNVNKEFFGGKFRFGRSDLDASKFLRESSVLGKICNLPRQQDPTP